MNKRPNVLSIAGFDPSSGAGVAADIKTMDTLKCMAFGVNTANTIQNDTSFEACFWMDKEQIKAQIKVLFNRFEIDFVKIGIVENWTILKEIIACLKEENKSVKIILDPVLSASSSFELNKEDNEALLDDILENIYLITPNYQEIKQLYPKLTLEDTIVHISSKTNLFLKGGHREDVIGKDELFTLSGTHKVYNPKVKNISEKHGSGCVLSSAITSYLALGFTLSKACLKGKHYTAKFLSSNDSLLGYHKR